MNAVITSLELSREIEAVEQELSDLRTRVEEDSSVFAALEQQVAELREDLAKARSNISEHEARLVAKQTELAEAKRLEALANYKEELGAHDEARAAVIRVTTDLLAAVDGYDDTTLRVRRLVKDMRKAFGNDERVAEVEAALGNEPEELRDAWAAVVATVGWRIHGANGDDREVEVEVELDEDPGDAHERRVARIKEYFSRS
jgi:chromosome segregation ATPase